MGTGDNIVGSNQSPGSRTQGAGRRMWSVVGAAPVWLKIAGIVVAPMVLVSFAVWVAVALSSADGLVLDRDRIVGGVIALGVTGSIGVAFAALLAHVLTRPMHNLIWAMQRVEGGERDVTVEPWADDEIGEAQRAFNELASQLQVVHDELLQRNIDLACLNELAEIVALGRTSGQVTAEVLPLVLSAVDADHATLYAPSGSGRFVIQDMMKGTETVSGPSEVEAETLHGTLMDQVMLTSRPLALRGVNGSDLPDACHVSGTFDSWVCVPLRVHQVAVGGLGVGRQAGPPFGEHALGLLDSIGQVIGIGVLNAQLLADREESEAQLTRALRRVVEAQEDERRRISRELHDEAGQALTSMLLQLKNLQAQEDIDVIHDRINGLRYMTSSTLDELRRLSTDLRPTILDDLGLVPALRWLVRRNVEISEIKIRLEVDNLPRAFSEDMQTGLFRIVQEGLTNVVRHSLASNADVALQRRNGRLVVTIADDGRGFDPRIRPGLGLVGMRERAELLGGRFAVGPGALGGTELRIEVPLEVSHD